MQLGNITSPPPYGPERPLSSQESQEQQRVVEAFLNDVESSGLFSGVVAVGVGDAFTFRPIMDATFSEKTLFNCCSSAKMLTCMALHQVVGNHLERPLSEFLTVQEIKELYNSPEAPEKLQEHMKAVRLVDLLNHTSGCQEEGAVEIFDASKLGSFHYSNLGFNILAKIVAKRSGCSFEQYIKENIFASLGMQDALNYYQNQDERRLPVQQSQSPSGKIVKIEDRRSSTGVPGGNGCWEISCRDWMNFAKAIQVKGPFKDFFEQMKQRGVPYREGGLYGQALEIFPLSGSAEILGHDGNAVGASCGFYVLERPGKPTICIIALSNMGGRGGPCALGLAKTLAGAPENPLAQTRELQQCFRLFAAGEMQKAEAIMHALLKGDLNEDYVMAMAHDLIDLGKISTVVKVVDILCQKMKSDAERSEWRHKLGVALHEYGTSKNDLGILRIALDNLQFAHAHSPLTITHAGFRQFTESLINDIKSKV